MGCGEFLVKTILFVSNLFFVLAGLTLVGIGAVVQIRSGSVVTIGEWNFSAAPITTMVVGGIIFFIAFFGCCGAIRESNCMLVTYGIFMILLMIVKVALATVIFVNLQTLLDDIPIWLNKAFSENKDSFQAIESTFHCCGTMGAISYQNLTLPETCCATTPCTILNAYSGCNSVVDDFFNTFGLLIGSVAIVIAAIELVAVVFSLCLANHARNKSRRARY